MHSEEHFRMRLAPHKSRTQDSNALHIRYRRQEREQID